MNKTFVSCYQNPDLDGFACAIAYTEFLNAIDVKSVPAIFGAPHIEVKYVMDRFGFQYPEPVFEIGASDKIILVDASVLHILDKQVKPLQVIEIIDHRQVNDSVLFTNAKIQIELVGAAATLIAQKFFNAKIPVSRESAILLYGAIISNTLNLKSSHTTDRDRKMAARLNEEVKLPNTFPLEMFRAKSDLSGDRLKETLEGDCGEFSVGSKRFGVAQLEMVGGKNLIATRIAEILSELKRISAAENYVFTFLSIIELEEGCNYFVTDNPDAQKLLTKVFGVSFTNNVARHSPWLMRKQLIPLLKSAIEEYNKQ